MELVFIRSELAEDRRLKDEEDIGGRLLSLPESDFFFDLLPFRLDFVRKENPMMVLHSIEFK
jgi:hypothetical protein